MKIGLVRKELRGEVRAFAVGLRRAGLGLMGLGLVLIVWPRVTGDWPMLGPVPLQHVGWGLVGLAWIVWIVVIIRRSAFYRRRLRELETDA